jgi:hypothetical protein
MPFHVEIRRSFHLARAFNLDPEELRRTVLEPWRRGGPIELGDREWDPRESSLRVIEGPELEPVDLSMGRGWQKAERSGEDVTRGLLAAAAAEAAAVTVVGDSPSALRVATEALRRLKVRVADWAAVRELITTAGSHGGAAPGGLDGMVAILAVEGGEAPERWLFEAGLAIGALRGRAIVALTADREPPPELRQLGSVRIDPARAASLDALAESLRHAGFPAGFRDG